MAHGRRPDDTDPDLDDFLLEEEEDDDTDDYGDDDAYDYDDTPTARVDAESLADVDAMNDPDVQYLGPPPQIGGPRGEHAPVNDIFTSGGSGGGGRASTPKLYAQASAFPEVVQLRVWKWENGVPVSLGVIDAEATEEDLVREFWHAMPMEGEGRAQFRFRPVNIRGKEVGTEHSVFIGEHHKAIVARRKREETKAGHGGIDINMLRGSDGSSRVISEMSRMSEHLLASAEERAERLEREREALREQALREERQRTQERVDMASSTLESVKSMTERLMADERARNKEMLQRTEILARQQNESQQGMFQQMLAMQMQTAEMRQREDDRRLALERQRQEEMRREEERRRERERAELEHKLRMEREEAERRRQQEREEFERRLLERQTEKQMELERIRIEAEQKAAQAREEAERRQRDHERSLEMVRQELQARRDQEREEQRLYFERMREEREVRERREREEREARDRWMAEQRRQEEERRREHERRLADDQRRREEREREEQRRRDEDRRLQHERMIKEMEMDRERDREHRLHLQRLAQKEIEAANKQGGFDSIMTGLGMLKNFGVDPGEALGKVFGADRPSGGWSDQLPKILGGLAQVLPTLQQGAKQGRPAVPPGMLPPPAPTWAQDYSRPPQGEPVPTGQTGRVQRSAPAPAPSTEASGGPQPPVARDDGSQSLAYASPEEPEVDLLKLANDRGVSLKDQRAARQALRKLLKKLRRAPETDWEDLITAAIMEEGSIFLYAKALGVEVVSKEAGGDDDMISKIVETMKQHPLVPEGMPYTARDAEMVFEAEEAERREENA